MKCLNEKVVQKKRALRLETEKTQEEIRWNSLTPEEQKKSLLKEKPRCKQECEHLEISKK